MIFLWFFEWCILHSGKRIFVIANQARFSNFKQKFYNSIYIFFEKYYKFLQAGSFQVLSISKIFWKM